MELILLERVENLGQMGDVVNVKPGYARNFLLPRGKALRANKDNIAYFEAQKKQLEAENIKKKDEAEKVAKKIDGLTVSIIRQASEGGQLYGSVASRDIAEAVTRGGATIDRDQVVLDRNFKALGLYPVKVVLHPEVSVEVTINIARTEEEAEIQLKSGEALVTTDDEASLAEVAIETIEEIEAEEIAEEEGEEAEAEAAEAAEEGEEAATGDASEADEEDKAKDA